MEEKYTITMTELLHLVDVVWNYITESEEVPSTILAKKLINKAIFDKTKE